MVEQMGCRGSKSPAQQGDATGGAIEKAPSRLLSIEKRGSWFSKALANAVKKGNTTQVAAGGDASG